MIRNETEKKECFKCGVNSLTIKLRNHQCCQSCFIKFVEEKFKKQIKNNKFKINHKLIQNYDNEKILLAFSGGKSSIVLLNLIILFLNEQGKLYGKYGFKLVVVNICSNTLEIDSLIEELKIKIYKINPKLPIDFKCVSIESYLDNKSVLNNVHLSDNSLFADVLLDNTKTSMKEFFKSSNPKSQHHFLNIIIPELLLKTAYSENCNTVLYSNSATRLAVEALSLVVTGNSSALNSNILNQKKEYHEKLIEIIYPLRDLYINEIDMYFNYCEFNLFSIESVQHENTIKKIFFQYFSDIEELGYSNLSSTVLNTAQKLKQLTFNEEKQKCDICNTYYYIDPKNWIQKISSYNKSELDSEVEIQNFNLYKSLENNEKKKIVLAKPNLCYSCYSLINSSNIKNNNTLLSNEKINILK